MKITKEYLKQIIKEELSKVAEAEGGAAVELSPEETQQMRTLLPNLEATLEQVKNEIEAAPKSTSRYTAGYGPKERLIKQMQMLQGDILGVKRVLGIMPFQNQEVLRSTAIDLKNRYLKN